MLCVIFYILNLNQKLFLNIYFVNSCSHYNDYILFAFSRNFHHLYRPEFEQWTELSTILLEAPIHISANSCHSPWLIYLLASWASYTNYITCYYDFLNYQHYHKSCRPPIILSIHSRLWWYEIQAVLIS